MVNHNVRITFAVRIADGIATGIWASSVLSTYINVLEGDNDEANEKVGYAQAIQGTFLAVAALPAGWLAIRHRRDSILKVMGLLAFAAIATTSAALILDVSYKYELLCCGLALWGVAQANAPVLDALFADSVATGSRSKLYTWLHMSYIVSQGIGPGVGAIIFALNGNVWRLDVLQHVMLVGMGLAVLPALLMLCFDDDKALGAESEGLLRASLLGPPGAGESAGDSDSESQRSGPNSPARPVQPVMAPVVVGPAAVADGPMGHCRWSLRPHRGSGSGSSRGDVSQCGGYIAPELTDAEDGAAHGSSREPETPRNESRTPPETATALCCSSDATDRGATDSGATDTATCSATAATTNVLVSSHALVFSPGTMSPISDRSGMPTPVHASPSCTANGSRERIAGGGGGGGRISGLLIVDGFLPPLPQQRQQEGQELQLPGISLSSPAAVVMDCLNAIRQVIDDAAAVAALSSSSSSSALKPGSQPRSPIQPLHSISIKGAVIPDDNPTASVAVAVEAASTAATLSTATVAVAVPSSSVVVQSSSSPPAAGSLGTLGSSISLDVSPSSRDGSDGGAGGGAGGGPGAADGGSRGGRFRRGSRASDGEESLAGGSRGQSGSGSELSFSSLLAPGSFKSAVSRTFSRTGSSSSSGSARGGGASGGVSAAAVGAAAAHSSPSALPPYPEEDPAAETEGGEVPTSPPQYDAYDIVRVPYARCTEDRSTASSSGVGLDQTRTRTRILLPKLPPLPPLPPLPAPAGLGTSPTSLPPSSPSSSSSPPDYHHPYKHQQPLAAVGGLPLASRISSGGGGIIAERGGRQGLLPPPPPPLGAITTAAGSGGSTTGAATVPTRVGRWRESHEPPPRLVAAGADDPFRQYRFLCLTPAWIPGILALTDCVMGLASGMTIKFFPIFFKDMVELQPMYVNLMYCVIPLCLSAAAFTAQRQSRFLGRIQTMVLNRGVGICLLYWIATHSERWHQPRLMVPIYVMRTSIMNSIYPLQKSVLMDFVPKEQRAAWNSLESITSFGWSGSAALGGWLIHRYGFRVTFLVTACMQSLGWLTSMLLLPIVPRKEGAHVHAVAPSANSRTSRGNVRTARRG